MTRLRRHGLIIGIAVAWLLALGATLGGLTLARTLPQAHARALAADALCIPEHGAIPDPQAHHAAGCVLCPGPAYAPAVSAPPPAPAAKAEPARLASDVVFAAGESDWVVSIQPLQAQARAPPRA